MIRVGQGSDIHALVIGRKLIIGGVDIAHELGQIHFAKDAPIDGLSLIKLIQSDRKVQLNGQDKIKILYAMPELKDKVSRVHQVLDQLRIQAND